MSGERAMFFKKKEKKTDPGTETWAIIGLGNPEDKYAGTRHNAGFDVIDMLAEKLSVRVKKNRHYSLCGDGRHNGKRVILAKPQTYMNRSGQAIRAIVDFYGLDPKDHIIVICDDISLEVGRIRIRKKGSAGGHNGLKDIIAHLSSDEFIRIKVGVGADENGDLVRHVLGRFGKAEREAVRAAEAAAAEAALFVIDDGADAAMNEYNGFNGAAGN